MYNNKRLHGIHFPDPPLPSPPSSLTPLPLSYPFLAAIPHVITTACCHAKITLPSGATSKGQTTQALRVPRLCAQGMQRAEGRARAVPIMGTDSRLPRSSLDIKDGPLREGTNVSRA
jgi:hypothetical protein